MPGMSSVSTPAAHALRPRILERRARLQQAAGSVSDAYLSELLSEVDAALERIDHGTYGICELCHDTIEADRLEVNPLVRFCLDHLSGPELEAHQQDLDLATRIQARLLPPCRVEAAHWDTHYRYEPVGPVGGDYCELLPLAGSGSLFFAVGDVAGKGVAASLLMTHLSAIFRSLLSLDFPLAEVMSRANRLFCESTTGSHYATLACGRATAQGLELANAGHCRPLLLRRDGTERVEAAGVPLGMFRGAEYPVTRATLAQGESLVLYSDGVTETEDLQGVDFGEDRLIRSLRGRFGGSAETIALGVVDDVTRFRGARRPFDDLTVLVVRRQAA